MANKQAPAQKKRPKWLYVLIPVLVIALIAGGIGIYYWVAGSQPGLMTQTQKTQYNTAITEKAWLTGSIGNREILIVHTVDKNTGGDTQLELYVYKLPDGANAKEFLHLNVSQVTADMGLEHMGFASCRLAGDKLESIYNLQVKYIR